MIIKITWNSIHTCKNWSKFCLQLYKLTFLYWIEWVLVVRHLIWGWRERETRSHHFFPTSLRRPTFCWTSKWATKPFRKSKNCATPVVVVVVCLFVFLFLKWFVHLFKAFIEHSPIKNQFFVSRFKFFAEIKSSFLRPSR